MNSSVYPAKIDWWLWPILIGSSLGLVVWGALVWESNRVEALILIGTGIFDGILFSALLYPCYYTIEESHVLIRSGIIKFRVAINTIQSVTPTWNPLSAPAPSLKRVEIRLKNGRICLVSPADRNGFIEELNRRIGLAS